MVCIKKYVTNHRVLSPPITIFNTNLASLLLSFSVSHSTSYKHTHIHTLSVSLLNLSSSWLTAGEMKIPRLLRTFDPERDVYGLNPNNDTSIPMRALIDPSQLSNANHKSSTCIFDRFRSTNRTLTIKPHFIY